MKTARTYQTKGIDEYGTLPVFCFNLDCGTGKSYMTAIVAQNKNLPTAIIAPKRLCNQWKDELIEAGVSPEDIFVHDQSTETGDPVAYQNQFTAWLES